MSNRIEMLTKPAERQLEVNILTVVHDRIRKGMTFTEALKVLESVRFELTEIKLKHGVE